MDKKRCFEWFLVTLTFAAPTQLTFAAFILINPGLQLYYRVYCGVKIKDLECFRICAHALAFNATLSSFSGNCLNYVKRLHNVVQVIMNTYTYFFVIKFNTFIFHRNEIQLVSR